MKNENNKKKNGIVTNPKRAGEFLHTKHAFPPNSLGYCGPDVRGKILDYLHNHADGIEVSPVLTKFEAAYPFVKLIAEATGRKPFDYDVAEAYWLGNSILDQVEPSDFFEFSYDTLTPSRMTAGKRDGLTKQAAKSIFRKLGHNAKPHHTFYVLGMYAKSSVRSGTESKLLELMDSCRISWGRVLAVKKESLVVNSPSLELKDEKLSLSPSTRKKEIRYDPEIPPFSEISKGDWVSIHWNFASEKLSPLQARNLKNYTLLDIDSTNRLAEFSKTQ